VKVVIGEVVYDDAVNVCGESLEEANCEVMGEGSRHHSLLDGDVDGEALAGTDGEAELAFGGILQDEQRESLVLIAEVEALLEDAHHLELDFVLSGVHGSPFAWGGGGLAMGLWFPVRADVLAPACAWVTWIPC